MSAFDFVKRHPVAIGVGALIVIAGAFLLSGSGDAPQGASGGPSDASIAAGVALQQQQYAYAAASSELSAQREISLASLASAERMAALEFDYRRESEMRAESIRHAEIAAGVTVSSLETQLRQREIDAETERNAAQLATITAQSQLQAQTAQAALNTQLAVVTQQTKCKSLFCKIFG